MGAPDTITLHQSMSIEFQGLCRVVWFICSMNKGIVDSVQNLIKSNVFYLCVFGQDLDRDNWIHWMRDACSIIILKETRDVTLKSLILKK